MTTCIEFDGYITDRGYGQIGRNKKAHRVAWQEAHGPIPKGMCVLHTCDNRACVNPKHLFLGTHLDNVADMHAKGRGHRPQGELNAKAKLTEDDVRAIRVSTARPSELARQYGVAACSITNIRAGRFWRHL